MQMQSGSAPPSKSNVLCDSAKEGETSQVNNIDVSHGGTLLINTGEGKEFTPLLTGSGGGGGTSTLKIDTATAKNNLKGTGGKTAGGGGGRGKQTNKEKRGGKTISESETVGQRVAIPVPTGTINLPTHTSTLPLPSHPPGPPSIPPATPSNVSMRSLSSTEMKQREKSMMQELVKKRLEELSGRTKKKRTVAGGADGLGEEREILHAVKKSRNRQTPPSSMDVSDVTVARKAAIPMEITTAPTKLSAQTRPLPPPPAPTTTIPPPFLFSKLKPVPAKRPRKKVIGKKKAVKNDMYIAKPLRAKHPRSWVGEEQTKKRTRVNFPFNRWPYTLPWRESAEKRKREEEGKGAPLPKSARRGKAGMSRVNKRKLDDIDWTIAEEDAEDVLPPSKRKPYVGY